MAETSKSVWTALQLAAIVVAVAGGFAAARAWQGRPETHVIEASRPTDPETTSSFLKLRDAR